MTAVQTLSHSNRVHMGRLKVKPSPMERALTELEGAVPTLEASLAFPLSVTAQPMADGTITAEVIMPDAHYSFERAMTICAALRDSVRPFGIDLNVEVDSDFQYGE